MTDAIKKLREPAALGAAAYAGLSVLAAVISLLFSSGGTFSGYAFNLTQDLLSFPVALAVSIAVYLANHQAPALAKARLITLVALVTVAVAGVFGLVSFFAGFGADGVSGTAKFTYFLAGAAGAIALGLAAWYTWLTWQTHAPARPAAPTPAAPGGWVPGQQQGPAQQQQQQAAQQPGQPPAGFGWTPGNANEQTAYLPPQAPAAGPPQTLQAKQSATGSFSVPAQGKHGQPPQQQPQMPQQPGAGDRTQMMPPVPPTMQEYAPNPQPWQPAGPGTGGGVPPQQPQPTRPMAPGEAEHEERQGPFGVGSWE